MKNEENVCESHPHHYFLVMLRIKLIQVMANTACRCMILKSYDCTTPIKCCSSGIIFCIQPNHYVVNQIQLHQLMRHILWWFQTRRWDNMSTKLCISLSAHDWMPGLPRLHQKICHQRRHASGTHLWVWRTLEVRQAVSL